MSLPADLTLITVTATYATIQGAPLTGQVSFGISAPVQDSAGKVILGVGTQSVTLNSAGYMSITLPCTDNAGLNPVNFSYLVTENVPGLGRAYYIQLPHTLGSTVDLSALAPVSPPPAATAFATTNTWTAKQILSGNPPLQITTGAAAGDVLTSDAAGNATWGTPSSGWPGTTLGDTVYGGTGGAQTRLAGNTSAAKQFLTQTGTGTGSAAPAWEPVQPADLAPVGSPAPGKYAALLYGAVWGWPWQFWYDSYGCKGDGVVLGDVSITSGQNVASSASVGAVAGDAGKYMLINGAQGATSPPLIARVSSVSGGKWNLASNATATVSGNGSAFLATDDGAGLISMAQAMQTYALASDYVAQGMLGDSLFGAVTLFRQSTGPLYNTHFPVLYPAVNGTSRQPDLELIGAGSNGSCQFWESTVPNLRGACIVSMVNAPGVADSTFGQQSVIGGPTGGGAFTGSFANVHVTTRGVTVAAPAFPNQIGMDFAYLAGWTWDECSALTLQAVAGNSPNLPQMPPLTGFQSTIGVGFRAPLVGNNDAVSGHRLAVEAYETCGWVADHFTCDSLATIYPDLGLLIDLTHSTSGNAHGVTIANWSCEAYNGALKCNGGGTAYCPVNIFLDTETTGNGDPTYDVNDNGNLHGIIRIADNGARTNRRPVIANGAPNLKVVNDMIGPGHWAAAPAVPASGTAVAAGSLPYRDASIVVHTGAGVTVSAITLGGVSTGLTMSASSSLTLPVLPGGTAPALTYSGGTPTWDWWLE